MRIGESVFRTSKEPTTEVAGKDVGSHTNNYLLVAPIEPTTEVAGIERVGTSVGREGLASIEPTRSRNDSAFRSHQVHNFVRVFPRLGKLFPPTKAQAGEPVLIFVRSSRTAREEVVPLGEPLSDFLNQIRTLFFRVRNRDALGGVLMSKGQAIVALLNPNLFQRPGLQLSLC